MNLPQIVIEAGTLR